MKSETVQMAQGYANALFEVAQSQGCLEEVHNDLHQLHQAFHTVEGVQQGLAQVKTLPVQEAKAFVEPFYQGMNGYIQNAITLMVEAYHVEALPALYEAFLPSYEAFKGIGHVHVGTAVSLSAETEAAIAKRLKVLFKLQEVHLEHKIEPDLLGGLYVEYRGMRLDASLKRKLSALESHISHV
jgi:F-type H+-transporting ATPase subunit delta